MLANQPPIPSISTPPVSGGIGGTPGDGVAESMAGAPRVQSRTRSRTQPRRATIGIPDSKSTDERTGNSTVLARLLPSPIKFEGFYHTNFHNLLYKLKGLGSHASMALGRTYR